MADRADRPDRPEPESDDPALAIAARHALHDEELIAAFATDGDGADDPARARSLIERCQACQDLYADVVAIGGALRAVSSAETSAASYRAPRDFRLSVETANRLRPGSVVIRLRDRIRDALGAFGRPLGMSMASLGVVGLLLGSFTLGQSAGVPQAPEDAANGGGIEILATSAAPGSSPGPKLETQDFGTLTGTSGGGGGASETMRATFDERSTASTVPVVPGSNPVTAENAAPSLSALLVVGSAVLLVGGVALIVLGSRRGEPIPGP